MSSYYGNYSNKDPSVSKLASVDREGRLYQVPQFTLGANEFEVTKTLVPAVNGGSIPAAAIVGGMVEISEPIGAGFAMLLPSMASTPASTDLIQLIVNPGNLLDLKGVSNSTAGASSTGPVRGFEFVIYNNTDQTMTIGAPGDTSIAILQGAAQLLTQQARRCRIYAVRTSTGTLSYNFLIC